MITLSYEQVLHIHERTIIKHGGSQGVRDSGLIQSALLKACATFDGQDLYPSTINKIATITFSLVKNHGFIDGNKRVGAIVMITLCRLNKINISISNYELTKLILGIADSSINENKLNEFLQTHTI
ncbi:MAG: death-on-curing protein [Epulopiscium sp. Nele67-Bin004]|nr:MAG: death-on-curing protein [Epulopiscium sp. Nele67-Bin004]